MPARSLAQALSVHFPFRATTTGRVNSELASVGYVPSRVYRMTAGFLEDKISVSAAAPWSWSKWSFGRTVSTT